MNSIIEIKNLNFKYNDGKIIFQNLNIDIVKGKITTILGKNGCGKSTLINLLAKNITNYTGEITLDNKNLAKYSQKELATILSIVYQNNSTPQELTVYDMVSFARLPYQNILFYKKTTKDIEKIEYALSETELLEYKNTKVDELSGGQLQRVYIAMCLAQDTKIIILDEPTTFLDIKYQKSIMKLVKKLNSKFGITIVMVLHDINQAIAYSDNIIALLDGKVIMNNKANSFLDEQLLNKIYDTNIKIENEKVITW